MLNEEAKNIVNDNSYKIETIQLLLQGTEIASALQEYQEAEKLEAEAKWRSAAAKKELACFKATLK